MDRPAENQKGSNRKDGLKYLTANDGSVFFNSLAPVKFYDKDNMEIPHEDTNKWVCETNGIFGVYISNTYLPKKHDSMGDFLGVFLIHIPVGMRNIFTI